MFRPYFTFYDADPAPGTPADPDPAAALPPLDAAPADPSADPPADPALPPADPDPVSAYDWEADTGKLGEYAMPEGLTIGGQEVKGSLRETLEGADKRVTDLRKIISEKGYAAPETYTTPDDSAWAADDMKEVVEPLHAAFKELNLSQTQADGTMDILGDLANAMAETAQKANQVDLMTHWNLTGDAFAKRLGEVAEWAKSHMEPEVYEALRAQGTNGIILAENQMLSNRENPLYKGPGTVDKTDGLMSPPEIKALMESDAYNDAQDPGYAAARAQSKAHFEVINAQKKKKASDDFTNPNTRSIDK